MDLTKTEVKKSGPFGIAMGTLIEDLGFNVEEIAPFKYCSLSVPKPHSTFEKYVMEITPTHGVSWIKSISKEINTSPYGVEIKTEFEKMNSKLEKKYGKPELTDMLLPGSIWNEPRDWTQSLINRERILMSQWDIKDRSNIFDGLISIGLIASAYTTSEGYIAIEYTFSNNESAQQEVASLEDDVL